MMDPVTRPLSILEVAERAGIPLELAQAFADAGAYERDLEDLDEGSVRRAMLLAACVEAGLPVEAIGSAIRSEHATLSPMDRPYYARWAHRLEITWEELAAQAGVPMGLLRSLYEALGLPPPEPGDHPRVDEPVLVRSVATACAAGYEEGALVGLMRVYGESLRRIARTETQLWHQFVDVPAERAGLTQRQILDSSAEVGEAIAGLMDDATWSMYHRMQEHAWMNDLIEHIELGMVEAGVYARPERASAIAFMDLAGYTALTEERGDRAAAEVATRMAAIAQRLAVTRGGEAMKFLGDGALFRFRDPAAGVHGALDVVDATPMEGLPPAHVGMHIGAVIERDGDVFGRTVNLASRISTRAGAGEVLVTSDVVESIGSEASIMFAPIGPVELRGVAAPVRLFRAQRN